jgi:trehalose 6-phosphate phosphatase
MKDILARRNLPVLAQLAWSKVLLAFDFDGTLAPLVDDPRKARISPAVARVFAPLSRVYPCAAISGRPQPDLARRMAGLGAALVIGHHGLEPSRGAQPFAARVQEWVPHLRARLAGVKGVVLENKTFALAVHYRKAPSKKQARAAIQAAVSTLRGLRAIRGKHVFNLIPDGAPHKGIALEAAMKRLRCDTALYVGDDETDEDVFALDDPGRILTVRVGRKSSSGASFFIASQAAIPKLLAALLELRRERQSPDS